MNTKEIRKAITKLGPWHQRYEMNGLWTTNSMLSGEHVWPSIRSLMDDDLEGARILDIDSKGGYYSSMLALEGVDVTSVEPSNLYFQQSQWTKHYFEQTYKKKLTIKLMKTIVSNLGWFDYILTTSEDTLLKQQKGISEICQRTDKVIIRIKNKSLKNSVGYYTSMFLKNEFYLLKKLTGEKQIILYGKLIKDEDEEYTW